MAASAQSLTTLRGENERLRQEAEEANRRLKETQQREEQARTRWAYAEGERDSLQAQLTALTTRIEGVLQAATQRARMATMNPPGELFGPSPPAPEAAPAPSTAEPPAAPSPGTY
jgi:dTMP kinase